MPPRFRTDNAGPLLRASHSHILITTRNCRQMRIFSIGAILTQLLAISVRSQNVKLTDCGLLGPIYPTPSNLSNSKAIRDAQKTFASLLNQAVQNQTAP